MRPDDPFAAPRAPGEEAWTLLALLPLMAVSDTAVPAIALGLGAALLLLGATPLLHALLPRIEAAIRLPFVLLLSAIAIALLELGLRVGAPALHATIARALPLLVLPVLVAQRQLAIATPPMRGAWRDAARQAVRALALLTAFGLAREALAHGSLFAGAGPLLGLPQLERDLGGRGLALAALPPGALLLLGLGLALHRRLRRARGADA